MAGCCHPIKNPESSSEKRRGILNYEPEDSRRFRMHRDEVIIYWSDEDNAFMAESPNTF
jgi:hypothetical protein